LGLAIFKYATQSLRWSARKGLFASLFATLYFVGLRISWDMLRCELGLIFIFVFLLALQKGMFNFKWKWFSILSFSTVLVVLTHQLMSVIMFAIVFAVTIKKLVERNYSFVRRFFMVCLPAIALFTLTFYAYYIVLPNHNSNIFWSGQLEWLSIMGYSSIVNGITNTLGFLIFCYVPFLPFVIHGARRFISLELKAWATCCLAGCAIGAFLPLYFPLVPLSYRWIILLIFPLAFFVAEGFEKINYRLFKNLLIGFMIFFNFCFIFLPAEASFPYLNYYPHYIPSSMLQNSVSLRDCKDVVEAFSWVKASVGSNGVLLVHDAFYGWALLYGNGVKILCYGYASPSEIALIFSEQGYQKLFLVWWVRGEGWHGQSSLSSSFKEVFRSGRIAVYSFEIEGQEHS
jgi:hypothetical protein